MIKIYWDRQGFTELMTDSAISSYEKELITQKLSQAEAAFLQTFGFEGKFIITNEIKTPTKKTQAPRMTYTIRAADARTQATLNKNPGWMSTII